MFERYTERARRVLFFARYEASHFGKGEIDTEHLLLGLVREGKGLTSRLFARAHLSLEGLRHEIEGRLSPREPIPQSAEMPFSAASKRVLQATAQEADRLLHNYIGTEHLLLGLLVVEEGVAAQILTAHGLRLHTVREDIVQLLNEKTTVMSHQPTLPRAARAYAMTVAPGRTPGRHPEAAGGGTGFGAAMLSVAIGIESGETQRSIGPLSESGTTMAEFARLLEDLLDAPVIDVTGLEGRYDIEVPGTHDHVESFIAALQAHTGLVLTPNASARRG